MKRITHAVELNVRACWSSRAVFTNFDDIARWKQRRRSLRYALTGKDTAPPAHPFHVTRSPVLNTRPTKENSCLCLKQIAIRRRLTTPMY